MVNIKGTVCSERAEEGISKKRGHGRSLAESSYQLSGDAICHATG